MLHFTLALLALPSMMSQSAGQKLSVQAVTVKYHRFMLMLMFVPAGAS